ncbi:hypothetical protein ACLESO_46485 [Pyxidicoccus sp. 3LG]
MAAPLPPGTASTWRPGPGATSTGPSPASTTWACADSSRAKRDAAAAVLGE